MSTADGRIEGAQRDSGRLLACALLLPPLVLAWPGPGSILRGDFLPASTGAGAAALAALPAALLLLGRGAAWPRAFLLFLVPLACLAAALVLGRPADTFEARRAALQATTSLVLLLGGARLSGPGRTIFARGLVLAAVLLLAASLLDASRGFGGALGNTGSVAQAALPGALAGACLATHRGRVWRTLGAAAVVLFLAFVARVPVIAGGCAFAVGMLAFALLRAGLTRRVGALALAAAALALLGVLAPVASRGASRVASGAASRAASPAGSGNAEAPATPAAGSDTGGFEVRARIASRSLAMLRDHLAFGVGPGQFAASFPPYRDPREIELSTHGRAVDAETEVEHPHDDWLAPALELGAAAGAAWIAFLAAVAWCAAAALRGGDDPLEGLAVGALGLLAYAFVHAPLTQEPAASAAAFVAFGAVLARRSDATAPGAARAPAARSGAAARLVSIGACILLALSAPRAFAFVRHGRAVSDLERSTLAAALEASPDSSFALKIRARVLEEAGADPATVRAAWERVLLVRPDCVEARTELAIACVRAGDLPRARAELERAASLDPANPAVVSNLRVLDLAQGRLETGRPWLAGSDPVPEACFARSRALRTGGDVVLADLFEARAHLLWAREHAAAGRFADAVRSYRQCVRVTRDHVEGGAVRVRLELAAALQADGRRDDARKELAAIGPEAEDRASLPAWASKALRDAAANG